MTDADIYVYVLLLQYFNGITLAIVVLYKNACSYRKQCNQRKGYCLSNQQADLIVKLVLLLLAIHR